jgi:hypothetical protein
MADSICKKCGEPIRQIAPSADESVERIAEILMHHKQLEHPDPAACVCSCGHSGIGFRESWDYHVARELVSGSIDADHDQERR